MIDICQYVKNVLQVVKYDYRTLKYKNTVSSSHSKTGNQTLNSVDTKPLRYNLNENLFKLEVPIIDLG